MPLSQVEAEFDWFTRNGGQVMGVFPMDGLKSLISLHRNAIGTRERRDDSSAFIENFHAQFAGAGVRVDKKVFSLKTQRSSGERLLGISGSQGGKTIPAKHGQAGAADSGTR
jgi:hypothetical protein